MRSAGPRRTRAALALAALLASAGGCGLPRDTAATVDGRAVPAADLEAAVRAFTGGLGPPADALGRELPRIRRAALERLIDRELMLAEAERRGLRPAPAQVEAALAAAGGGLPGPELEAALARAGSDRERWRRTVERDLAIRALQEQLAAAVTVDERELGEQPDGPRPAEPLPEQVRLSQILVREEAEALAARRRIERGEPFADVARAVSQSPDAARGGDLGFFARGQMPPEFEAVAFALPAGRLSEVVETPYGYHLFLVTGRREQRARTAAEEREDARAALLAARREAAFRAWLAEARRRATIRVNRALVPE